MEKSKKILIANKEAVICGWDLKKHCFKKKIKIIPMNSEHFSIMQLLGEHKLSEIKKFI